MITMLATNLQVTLLQKLPLTVLVSPEAARGKRLTAVSAFTPGRVGVPLLPRVSMSHQSSLASRLLYWRRRLSRDSMTVYGKPSPRPPQWAPPATYSASAPLPATLIPGPQAFSSPIPDTTPSAHTAIPVYSVSSQLKAAPQSSAAFTMPTSAAYPMSISMQRVTQQPTAATLPTLRYGVQQMATTPVTTVPGPSQLPASSHQATATTPHVPDYVQAASSQLHSAVYPPHPSPELLFASAYGIPRPSLPVFESSAESDFLYLS
ncbi:circadian locomoter output cycles kaput-like protein [Labeo rohita]|uniref:Circadian locomoter output cycles kaput-like protein n=1 Tax=Labeo rohita TaxID=84645 RepID=A0A498MIQ4_LABRO|nr:circadian locomoter output cycles kaput-like protein [Labeo rohita]